MADIIQFPEGGRDGTQKSEYDPIDVHVTRSDNIQLSGGIILDGECSELVHHFDSVPGNCRCGERYWDPYDSTESA